MENITVLIEHINNDLLQHIGMKSIRNLEPIIVSNVPEPWILIGVGNYAAVLTHPDFQEYAVKIYAKGREGINEEIKVYSKIENHNSFSKCFYFAENYLILKRIKGKTLYECLKEGIQIPASVIEDIDEALKYARSVGLNPHDVHAKNVMMLEGRGVVVDISDFNKFEECSLWKDFKKAYYKIYVPFLYNLHPPIPEFYLNIIRKSYRLYRNISK